MFFSRCPRVSCVCACTWPARPHLGAAPSLLSPSPASWRMFLTLICVSQPTCSGLITVRPVLINIQVWRAPRCLCFITAERSVCRVRPPPLCSRSDSSHDYTVSTVVIHLLPKLQRRTLSLHSAARGEGEEGGRDAHGAHEHVRARTPQAKRFLDICSLVPPKACRRLLAYWIWLCTFLVTPLIAVLQVFAVFRRNHYMHLAQNNNAKSNSSADAINF